MRSLPLSAVPARGHYYFWNDGARFDQPRPKRFTLALYSGRAGSATSAGIGFFHVGVEHRWWEGTPECGATATPDSLEALKAQLMNQPVVQCGDIAWEMFGISMAGYNFLLSAFAGCLAIILSLPRRS